MYINSKQKTNIEINEYDFTNYNRNERKSIYSVVWNIPNRIAETLIPIVSVNRKSEDEIIDR